MIKDGLWSVSDIHYISSNVYGTITFICTYCLSSVFLWFYDL